MAQKPDVRFGKLFQKLYNTRLWLMAYESIAPKPGNMTPGSDGSTIDGMGIERINAVITALKASSYKPKPVRRVYIPKANGKKRPLGIPCFEDKLLQTVVKLLLEAIYEPTFSKASHGFRPGRSCHTALEQVKKMNGVRWWVEGDIKSFFDDLNHNTMLRVLNKRITDKRFLHLIELFMKAGYIEDWQYHKTYSGTPQGGPLSPLLSNIYLNELDQAMEAKIETFNKGKRRQPDPAYRSIIYRKGRAKQQAQQSGDWSKYKELTQQQLCMLPEDPQDPNYKRLCYVRYADDFLVCIIGNKTDAVEIKAWLTEYLKTELQLELSAEKTLVTNARNRVRFLGYDVKRWAGKRRLKVRTKHGVVTKRTTTYHLALLIPKDKYIEFARTYGNSQSWRGTHRTKLLNLSELEIMMIYNAEIRGFLGYYALTNNLTKVASKLLWMTTGSFLRTLADKRKSTLMKVSKSLKSGPNRYVIALNKKNGTTNEYALVSSTRQIKRKSVTVNNPDSMPITGHFRGRTELGKRLCANKCEWCGTQEGKVEVHHIRKLKGIRGKSIWERHMIERKRKTMILCHKCHTDLHAGKLSAATKR